MSAPPILRHVHLMETSTQAEPRELLPSQVRTYVDIDRLTYRRPLADQVEVQVTWTLTLCHAQTGEIVAALSARFRLLYEVVAGASPSADRRLAMDHALPDVWPVWLGWLQHTLSLMAVGPAPLPPQLPDQAAVEADAVVRHADEPDRMFPRAADR